MSVAVDEKRWAKAQKMTLKAGNHDGISKGACVMELAAYVAGEPWSDHPECACPVITAFMISWNDGLPDDAERTRLLLPLIPKIVNTRGSEALENRRATMAADWLVRVHTPAWLRLAGLTAEADALANFPEITDFDQTPSIMAPLAASREAAQKRWDAARDAARVAAWAAAEAAAWDAAEAAAWDAARVAARVTAEAAAWAAARAAAWDAARVAAWAAARAAAWDAARAAAWAAARAAAWDAAWDAARAAARAAAWDAAEAAARAAARAAAWDAAWDALKPTQDALQVSALQLVERMCALTDADLA